MTRPLPEAVRAASIGTMLPAELAVAGGSLFTSAPTRWMDLSRSTNYREK